MFDCLTETEIRFLIASFGLFGTIIGYFLGHYLGKRNIRYQRFLIASTEFRNTFVDMLVFLDESRDKIPLIDKILGYSQDSALVFIQHNIAMQQEAFTKFSSYLKGSKLDNAKKAWRDYAYPNYKEDETNLSDSFRRIIAYRAKNDKKEQEVRKIIRDKINVLLSFAPTK